MHKTLEKTKQSVINLLDELYDALIIRVSKDDIKHVQGVFLGMRNNVATKVNIMYGEFEDYLTPPTADEIVKELNAEYGYKFKYFNGVKKFAYLSSDGYCEIVFYNEKEKTIMYRVGNQCPIKLAHKITAFFMAMEVE